jgi:NAD-dependent SIR2 family protein deacetylase
MRISQSFHKQEKIMGFMQLFIYAKGALYAADCDRCGTTMYTHEWINSDHNDRRDAMKDGTLRCDDCNGHAAANTFMYLGKQYAGRYSAPGYMDCTDWHFDANKRRLNAELRSMYGEQDCES